MALVSPGVEVQVIDESQYIPSAVNTVPYFLIATAQNKADAAGAGVAAGTTAANANKTYLITSQRDLAATFGVPFFYNTTTGTPINGYELNEYGLLAPACCLVWWNSHSGCLPSCCSLAFASSRLLPRANSPTLAPPHAAPSGCFLTLPHASSRSRSALILPPQAAFPSYASLVLSETQNPACCMLTPPHLAACSCIISRISCCPYYPLMLLSHAPVKP